VNMNYYNYDSRGLNSLQILSWLQSAIRLCDPSPDSKCVAFDEKDVLSCSLLLKQCDITQAITPRLAGT